MTRRPAHRLAMLALAALPLVVSCDLDDQTIGTATSPAVDPTFTTYSALGTSIGAGIQSGGINDSTQRESYVVLLAKQMGFTPNVNWFYPSFAGNGCPAPLVNALTGSRVGGVPVIPCGFRASSSIRPLVNNTSIPSLRLAQALDVTVVPFGPTDTLKLAQFIVGSRNPMDVVDATNPTFITVELGGNDVLGAATRGDPALLTPAAAFDASVDALVLRLNATGAEVAIANVPNVTSIPHFARASVAWCLKNGPACGFPAAAPFNLANFTIDNSCAPAVAGGIGDTYLLPFTSLGAMLQHSSAGRAVVLNCGTDVATVVPAAGAAAVPVPTLTAAEVTTIQAAVASFNAKIAAVATANNYALVDFNALLTAQAANIPVFPSLSTPTTLFGTLFSQDGIHPNAAGHKLIANAFIAAINAKFGTTLAVIP